MYFTFPSFLIYFHFPAFFQPFIRKYLSKRPNEVYKRTSFISNLKKYFRVNTQTHTHNAVCIVLFVNLNYNRLVSY